MSTRQTCKDTGSDKASETGSDHVASVEDSHSRSDLFLCIEQRQQEEGTGVELLPSVSWGVLVETVQELTGASVTPSMKRQASIPPKLLALKVKRQTIDQAVQKPSCC